MNEEEDNKSIPITSQTTTNEQNNSATIKQGNKETEKDILLNRAQLEDLETLRDRVDQLEVKSEEKTKPWYKTFGGITGIIAVGLSIFSVIYTTYKDRSSDLESKKKEVRDNLNNIILFERDAVRDADVQGMSLDDFVSTHWYVHERFEILLNNIDGVKSDILDQLSTEAYNHIAFCFYHFSYRIDKAFEYYDYALNVAKDAFDSANVYLGLSNIYYSTGVYFDLNKARAYLAKDINTLKRVADKRGYFYVTRDFADVASYESPFSVSMAKNYIDSSKIYLNIFKGNPYMYESLRGYINRNITFINTTHGQIIDTIKHL